MMRRANTIIALILIAGLGIVLPSLAGEEGGVALETLKARQKLVETAQDDLASAPDDSTRQESLNRAIRETFDFERLGRESIADHWKNMSAAQREEYLRLFRALVQKSTVRKLKAYRARGTEYVDVRTDSTEAVITTVVTSTDGDEVAIQYKMHRVRGRWWIWDTTIGLDVEITEYDVSSADNYRSAFNQIVSEEGIEKLLRKLRDKYRGGSEL